MTSARASALLTACIVLVSAACSSSIPVLPPACNAAPFTCAAGQTCWIASSDGNYTCLPSGSRASGDACENTVGTPTCGDGLDCFAPSRLGGTCAAYCDAAHPCAGGWTCDEAQVLGSTNFVHLCQPGDAGSGDAGSGDAGSDGG